MSTTPDLLDLCWSDGTKWDDATLGAYVVGALSMQPTGAQFACLGALVRAATPEQRAQLVPVKRGKR